jgi:glycosyltransferase involved in cell wall biosynthesis
VPSIALDYTPAYEQGAGIGRYVRELTAALALTTHNDFKFRLFVAGANPQADPPSPKFSWKPTRITPKWFARIWHRARLPIPVELFTGQVDLYHATDFVLPPTLSRTRTLLTVHDLSFVRVPEAASPRLKAYLDDVVPRSVSRAHHVLADSQATKDDLVSLYDTSPEKITVLLSGVDSRFKRVDRPEYVRAKYRISGAPYVLSVGTVQPRKNYGRLIEALALLRARGYELNLVIAGGRGWLEDPIYETIRVNHMEDRVHFIGFADDADLPALYSDAACFAFPSLYEGFGLPVLEAMGCETPVVTSNVSSLPEVAGDAALIVDPYDVDAIASAIVKLADDTTLRSHLINKGRERAQQFTWEKSAHHLLQIYADLLI